MNPQSPVSSLSCIAGAIVLAAGTVSGAMHFFSVDMDGAQEVPPNAASASGHAVVALDDALNRLSWNITWTNLSAAPTAMHFHGPAGICTNAAVQVDVGAISGLSSPSIGAATITGTQSSNFLAGLVYLNIHSSTFPGGEIRGQVTPRPLAPTVTLDGAQEVPPNGSPGSGSALVELTASNVLTWYVSFENLTGTITALHFHGPAAAGVNGPVQINVGAISGLSSPLDGSTTITAPQAADLLAGLWYLNLHSVTFPGGELRGQVPPIPESCIGTLVLVAAAVAAARAKHTPSMAATYTNSAECYRRQA